MKDILLKLNSAESIADKVEYFGQYFGQDWKEKLGGYWENQYELFIMSGTTPELAKIGADLATGELMTPVIGSLSKGNAIASDLGVLEGKLNNASKGNVGGKVVEGSSNAVKGAGNAMSSSEAASKIVNAERTGSALKSDVYHNAASYVSESQLASGKTFNITGGDGIQRTLLQVEGGVNGKTGIFEYIIEPNGTISHQLFKPGGIINGITN